MIKGWKLERAVVNSGCKLVPFDYEKNDSRGYTIFKDIAVSDHLKERDFVGCHELTHALLDHSRSTEQLVHKIFGDPKQRWQRRKQVPSFAEFLRGEHELDQDKNLHEIEAHTTALALATRLRLIDGVEWDQEREMEYVSSYALDYLAKGGDPAAYLSDQKNLTRLRAVQKQIFVAGFISPKQGQLAWAASGTD